ncbi:hypothetical protein QVE09_00245 [Paenibacillus sp. ClWae2A]|uniref:hypothetical protein n=1 Tax=Paenibacillus sp. ClWae2A TaxID=3057177 RepID=UPI0028F51AA4|nr:hypothetical protein [Paenibacillus sp. ClWae2A]MDT9717308.1 hypothetical protein [Paenibacillus sp. ClWae2A]
MKALITRYKGGHNPHEFRVYVIQSSTLKRFVVMEIILGSIVYNVALYLCHNALLAGVGSWAGTESMKRLPLVFRRIVGT